MLGLGNFYYELSVQVVQVCLATRAENGGLISFKELHATLTKFRGSQVRMYSACGVFDMWSLAKTAHFLLLICGSTSDVGAGNFLCGPQHRHCEAKETRVLLFFKA